MPHGDALNEPMKELFKQFLFNILGDALPAAPGAKDSLTQEERDYRDVMQLSWLSKDVPKNATGLYGQGIYQNYHLLEAYLTYKGNAVDFARASGGLSIEKAHNYFDGVFAMLQEWGASLDDVPDILSLVDTKQLNIWKNSTLKEVGLADLEALLNDWQYKSLQSREKAFGIGGREYLNQDVPRPLTIYDLSQYDRSKLCEAMGVPSPQKVTGGGNVKGATKVPVWVKKLGDQVQSRLVESMEKSGVALPEAVMNDMSHFMQTHLAEQWRLQTKARAQGKRPAVKEPESLEQSREQQAAIAQSQAWLNTINALLSEQGDVSSYLTENRETVNAAFMAFLEKCEAAVQNKKAEQEKAPVRPITKVTYHMNAADHKDWHIDVYFRDKKLAMDVKKLIAKSDVVSRLDGAVDQYITLGEVPEGQSEGMLNFNYNGLFSLSAFLQNSDQYKDAMKELLEAPAKQHLR